MCILLNIHNSQTGKNPNSCTDWINKLCFLHQKKARIRNILLNNQPIFSKINILKKGFVLFCPSPPHGGKFLDSRFTYSLLFCFSPSLSHYIKLLYIMHSRCHYVKLNNGPESQFSSKSIYCVSTLIIDITHFFPIYTTKSLGPSPMLCFMVM